VGDDDWRGRTVMVRSHGVQDLTHLDGRLGTVLTVVRNTEGPATATVRMNDGGGHWHIPLAWLSGGQAATDLGVGDTRTLDEVSGVLREVTRLAAWSDKVRALERIRVLVGGVRP
jgi:hypothetical protein